MTKLKNRINKEKHIILVVTSGSWRGVADFCRSASRIRFVPSIHDSNLGFRVINHIFKVRTEMDTKYSENKLLGMLQNVLVPKVISIPNTDYAVGEAPITVAEYGSYCKACNVDFPPQPSPLSENNPITNISYHDAVNYCNWLSDITGDDYRLPTEGEFIEYCGDHTEGNEDIAVFGQSSIKPVKTKLPNKYGLYDCLGLVWEWTSSQYE